MFSRLCLVVYLTIIPNFTLAHPHPGVYVEKTYTVHYPHKPETIPVADRELLRDVVLAAAAGYRCSIVRVLEYRRYQERHPAGDYYFTLTVCRKKKVLKWLGVIGRENYFKDVTPRPNWKEAKYE